MALTDNSVKQAYRDFLNTPEGVTLYHQFKRLLYTQDDSLIQWLNTSVLLALPPAREHNARVCDIGGGDGDRIKRILQFLHGKFRNNFRLDFIEQSPLHVAAYDPALLGQFCRTKVHNRLFEHVTLPTQSYDLVFLIHSIFAFENDKTIDKVLSLRRDSGNVVVVSNSPDSFLGGLKRIVDEELSEKRFELDDVEQALHKLGVTYERSRTCTEWAIEKKTWKHDMEIIWNWISLGRYHSLSDRRKIEVEEYVRDSGVPDGLRTFFREEEAVLTIPATVQQEAGRAGKG